MHLSLWGESFVDSLQHLGELIKLFSAELAEKLGYLLEALFLIIGDNACLCQNAADRHSLLLMLLSDLGQILIELEVVDQVLELFTADLRANLG